MNHFLTESLLFQLILLPCLTYIRNADWLKFSSNPTNHQSKRKKKSRDKLENQLVVRQYIPELKSLSFLSVGVPEDLSLC